MILLLAAAGVLSAALGDVTEAIVIFVVVVLNAWIGFRQEYRAEKAMASLQAMATPMVHVVRDGTPKEVRGPRAGARRPRAARGGLAGAGRRAGSSRRTRCAIEESALTGESVPVDKSTGSVAPDAPLAERTSMVYSGTSVAAGRGTMLVTATGMRAELGRVAGLLRGADAGKTPLQQRLDVLVRRLALAAGAIVVARVRARARARRADRHAAADRRQPRGRGDPREPAGGRDDHARARRPADAAPQRADPPLYAVETLGSVTTICSDKTGTLTQNRMTVVVLDMAGDRQELTDERASWAHRCCGSSRRCGCCSRAAALCNDAASAEDGSLLGDPTETALVAVAAPLRARQGPARGRSRRASASCRSTPSASG